jgi:hypothetical protein
MPKIAQKTINIPIKLNDPNISQMPNPQKK